MASNFVKAKKAAVAKSTIFDEAPDYDSEDEEHIALREKAESAINKGRNLLGGQDIEGDEDRYLSTAQKQQKGLKDKGPPKHTKKLKPGPIQEVNPITGRYMCDFPDSDWVEKFKSKQPPVPTAPKPPRVVLNESDLRLLKFLKAQLGKYVSVIICVMIIVTITVVIITVITNTIAHTNTHSHHYYYYSCTW